MRDNTYTSTNTNTNNPNNNTCRLGDVVNCRPPTPGVVNRAADAPARFVKQEIPHVVVSRCSLAQCQVASPSADDGSR